MGFEAELRDELLEEVAGSINDAYTKLISKNGVEVASYFLKLRYGVALMNLSEKEREEELAILRVTARD